VTLENYRRGRSFKSQAVACSRSSRAWKIALSWRHGEEILLIIVVRGPPSANHLFDDILMPSSLPGLAVCTSRYGDRDFRIRWRQQLAAPV
jgi:hypothetical protein